MCHSLPCSPWKCLGDQSSTGLAFHSLNPVLNTHAKMSISLFILANERPLCTGGIEISKPQQNKTKLLFRRKGDMQQTWWNPAGQQLRLPCPGPFPAVCERLPGGPDFDSVPWEVLLCPLPSVTISEMGVGKCELQATLWLPQQYNSLKSL